ncbi:MAG: WecB/TagA/CpsF family glycosyltransferase [Bacillota bacterium]
MQKVEIVGVNINNVTLEECNGILEGFLESDRLNMIFTPNSELLYNAVKDRAFEELLNAAQLVIPDGIGVVIASRFYKTPLKERVTGIDLMGKLAELAAKKGKNLYLLGASQEVIETAAERFKEKYEGINITGYRNGYFRKEDEDSIVDDINSASADILLVGLGSPKQEDFIYRNRDRLKAKVAIGIGGSFDIVAGKITRAPEFMQKAGLEWLHRLIKQPSRIGRMLKLPKFILLAFYDSKTRSR